MDRGCAGFDFDGDFAYCPFMMAVWTHMMSWPGAALKLCLVVGMLVVSGSAFAHGGHDCNKVTTPLMLPSVPVLPAASSSAPPIITEGAPAVAAVAPAEAGIRRTIDQARADSGVDEFVLSASASSRVTCPCGTRCGSCSSTSCCGSAVLPTALDWLALDAAATGLAARVQTTAGIFAAPLPRPPNP